MKRTLVFIFLLIISTILCSCTAELDHLNNPPQDNPSFPNGEPPIGLPEGPNNGVVEEDPKSEINEDIVVNPPEVVVDTDYQISYVSGTQNAYSINNDTITFTEISEETAYSITGSLDGNIVIDVGNEYKFELIFNGFTITSSSSNPIIIISGDEIQLTAKKDTINYIYDYRKAIDSTDSTLYLACLYSLVDLELAGKGKLEIYSENNNGVHTKDDLQVKNLSLNVVCMDNALKGNDSVTIESGIIKLVAKAGDGIKTTNSHINENENQKGNITILGATLDIYAACDGIDSAYDVLINKDSATVNVYTDKYSGYSDLETEVESNSFYYIRYSNYSYNYSIKYYNSETNEYKWENASYSSKSGRYYFYKINKPSGYDKLILYIYASNQEQGQDSSYYKSYTLSINDSYDTIAVSSRGSCDWTNYSSSQGGFGGGMQEGNTDKGEYSTKGIKADNQILISAGTIKINSYDDAIHANNTATLENGSTPLGLIEISGGNLTLYSNDDGIHADGNLIISGGTINVTYSYEGIEGNIIKISDGNIGIISKDDGINATATSSTSISFTGGSTFIYASGDGIDSNSTTSYSGIVFNGGDVVVISTSGGNSAIDSERGYTYSTGRVLAIMPSGGMSSEATNCSNFSSIATKTSLSLSQGNYLNISISSTDICTVKMPTPVNNAIVIYLGSKSASMTSVTSSSKTLDNNGIYWN